MHNGGPLTCPLGGLNCEDLLYLFTCSVCPLTTGSTEGTFNEDKKNSSIPSYVNVELDDRSVPMTTNPSYGQIELISNPNKSHYANL